MKLLFVVSLFIIFTFFSFAQSSHVSITPEQPKVGDKITVTYRAENPDVLLAKAESITALCLVYRGEEDPLALESPMKKNGTTWTASFSLTEKNARHLAFQFVADETYDDNERDCWTLFVYDKNDKPVQGAHSSLAEVLQNGGQYFGENQDVEQAKAEIARELELYPDNSDALVLYVKQHADAERNPETTERLVTTLNTLAEKFKNDEEKLHRLVFLFSMIGEKEKSKALEESVIADNPKGYFAQQKLLRPYYNEQNTDAAAEIIRTAVETFPDLETEVKQSRLENLVYRYTNEKQFEKAEEWLLKLPKPNGVYYNYLARTMVDDGTNLEKASLLAQKAVALNKAISSDEKKSYMRQSDFEADTKNKLGASLGTYGNALLKMEKFTEAEPVLHEAYEANGGASPDINQRYVVALTKNKQFGKAIEVGLACINKQKDNAMLLDNLKEAYIGRDGSEKNFADALTLKKKAFEEAITKAGKEHAAKIEKKIKEERTNKVATDFTLSDWDGTSVTLSALKGKVVIVDFWATWCGPCKQSFPYLQYVYEKYQSNENVKILALNTWERIKGDSAIIENAKKFMGTNKYSFPVLFDKNEVVNHYEVEGIPTKFIIDKKGNIAYTSIGFDGPQMVEEMVQEIEMLLKE
ncbi:MAG: redoxin domain-containing protein [Ignavibacteriae bacterium]|nr:redoxin domain-containing protein [Ignavibacteriota bacterium]